MDRLALLMVSGSRAPTAPLERMCTPLNSSQLELPAFAGPWQHRYLRSLPTRRSSDPVERVADAADGEAPHLAGHGGGVVDRFAQHAGRRVVGDRIVDRCGDGQVGLVDGQRLQSADGAIVVAVAGNAGLEVVAARVQRPFGGRL